MCEAVRNQKIKLTEMDKNQRIRFCIFCIAISRTVILKFHGKQEQKWKLQEKENDSAREATAYPTKNHLFHLISK